MPAKSEARTGRPTRVVRLHEASGSSRSGWNAAVGDAVRRSKAEVPTPTAVEVVRQWADLKGGKVSLFHVTVRIAWEQRLRPLGKVTTRKPA